MKKLVRRVSTMTGAGLLTTAMALPTVWLHGTDRFGTTYGEPAALEEGKMHVEWAPGQEAVVRLSAESQESLSRVRILSPEGDEIFDLGSGRSATSSLASIDLEFRAPNLAALMKRFPVGRYDIVAETTERVAAIGSAELSFDVPLPPLILHPAPGQLVDTRSLLIAWQAEGEVAGFEVELEQEDSDDGVRIKLPPEQTRLRIPHGFLKLGLATSLDVVAIGANGNRTVSEIEFITRP